MQRILVCLTYFLFTGWLNCHAVEKPSIHLFIHVCTINYWEQVLDRQLAVIHRSGLYDQCDSISLGVLGKGDIKKYTLKYPKLKILFQYRDTSLYERPTLYKLRSLCQENPEALVLYLHTKGVSRKEEDPNITDWSCYMEYFAIERWEDCVEALQEFDVCGVNWRKKPKPHFSGNFWWATARYITKLPEVIEEEYLEPEFWIGKESPQVRCFFQTGINHYDVPYPPEKYREREEPYIIAAVPEGFLKEQLEDYWDAVQGIEEQVQPVMDAPPHCKLISAFASGFKKPDFKKAIQETMALASLSEPSQKVRVVNLMQGNENQDLDFIQIKSSFLRKFASLFAVRLSLPITSTVGEDKILHIPLREKKVAKSLLASLHAMQRHIDLQADVKWSIVVYKIYGEKYTLLLSYPIE